MKNAVVTGRAAGAAAGEPDVSIGVNVPGLSLHIGDRDNRGHYWDGYRWRDPRWWADHHRYERPRGYYYGPPPRVIYYGPPPRLARPAALPHAATARLLLPSGPALVSAYRRISWRNSFTLLRLTGTSNSRSLSRRM